MSAEYIYETDYDTLHGTYSRVKREEIVRCRDCRFYDCGLCSWHECSYCGEPQRVDADGFCAWGKRKDDSTPGSGVSDQAADSNDSFVDSREKLEADVHDFCERFLRWDAGNGCEPYLLELLDRQAAITEREIEREWSCFANSVKGNVELREAEVAELKAKVEELTAERDHWRERYDKRNALANRYAYEIEKLEAECEKYREKFGAALDLVHEIERLAE